MSDWSSDVCSSDLLRNLRQRLFVIARVILVQAVIDRNDRIGLPFDRQHALHQRRTIMIGKIDHRRRPAERRRLRPGIVIVA